MTIISFACVNVNCELRKQTGHVLFKCFCVPMVVVVRFITVGFPVSLMRLFRSFSPGAIRILTWGGIRGGISVALALSMPVGPERNFILPVAYCVVVFSIVVQGLSLGWLVKKVEKEKVSNP